MVDVSDFSIFKLDYDTANGAGAFSAMVASIPEPGTLCMLAVGALVILSLRRRPGRLQAFTVAAVCISLVANSAFATAVDFTTYTVENYVPTTFTTATWVITPSTATVNSNADASVLYSPDSALNKRYIGLFKAGNDDDVIGFVLGFNPGDNDFAQTHVADYLLIDWKGTDQSNEFVDPAGGVFFHTRTTTGNMPAGIALSRVTGNPTADELWVHNDQFEDPSLGDPVGGVTQLARGATLGSSSYVTDPNALPQTIDITYTPNRIVMLVDGVQQFDYTPPTGTLPDGRFGLYSAWQGPPPTFGNFEVFSSNFTGLSAEVNRNTGEIIIKNLGTDAVPFDFYQFSSATNSLDTSGWNSLSDQNFPPSTAGDGLSWDEAGGSNAGAMAEFFLAGNSSLAGTPASIGAAYKTSTDGQDLVFSYRLPSGAMMTGAVSYVDSPPPGVPGDYNGNGAVDAADYVLWRNGGPLLNEVDAPGTVNAADHTAWRARFGNTSGSGSSFGGSAAVPEPASMGLLLCLGMILATRRAKFWNS